MGRAAKWGFGDVLVGVLMLGLLGTAGVTAAQRARETANRARCASNLHQIGLAILLYQQDNSQLLPRTVMGGPDDRKPTWGTPYADHKDLGPTADADPFDPRKSAQPAANDVTAAMFLLLRNEQISPRVFVCPSTRQSAWDFGGGKNSAQNWTNWQGVDGLGQHLSYSYQNPYVTADALNAGYNCKNPDPTFAVAADLNPGGEAVTTVTVQSPVADLREANSPNHAGAGQNVLFGDGHAEWVASPFAGTRHDNIYTAGGPELAEPGRGVATVVMSSVSPTDSVLLPSAKEVGYVPPPPAKPMTAAGRQAAAVALRGTYAARFGLDGDPATLTVDQTTIRCETGPLTVKFDYTVTGDDGVGVIVKLTAPNTHEQATLTLKNDLLSFDGGGKYSLDAGWRRVPAK